MYGRKLSLLLLHCKPATAEQHLRKGTYPSKVGMVKQQFKDQTRLQSGMRRIKKHWTSSGYLFFRRAKLFCDMYTCKQSNLTITLCSESKCYSTPYILMIKLALPLEAESHCSYCPIGITDQLRHSCRLCFSIAQRVLADRHQHHVRDNLKNLKQRKILFTSL